MEFHNPPAPHRYGKEENPNISFSESVSLSYQRALIIFAIFTGFASLEHLLSYNSKCKNFVLIFVVIFSGFSNFFIGLLYDIALNTLEPVSETGKPCCVNHIILVIVGNAVSLFWISLSVLRRNTPSLLATKCIAGFSGLCIFTGLSMVVAQESLPFWPAQLVELPVGFVSSFDCGSSVIRPLCLKVIMYEETRLWTEYLLVYLPILLTTLAGILAAYAKHSGEASWNFKIVQDCRQDGKSCPCVCNKLDVPLMTILIFSFVCLFIARPVMIVHNFTTSGLYQDSIPVFVNTVGFNVLSVVYLMNVWNRKTTHGSLPLYNKLTCVHI